MYNLTKYYKANTNVITTQLKKLKIAGPLKEYECSFMIKTLLLQFMCNHNLDCHSDHFSALLYDFISYVYISKQYKLVLLISELHINGIYGIIDLLFYAFFCSTFCKIHQCCCMELQFVYLHFCRIFPLYDSTAAYLSILLFMNTLVVSNLGLLCLLL